LLKYFVRLSEIGVSYSDLPPTPRLLARDSRRYAKPLPIELDALLGRLVSKKRTGAYSHTLFGKEATTLRFRNYVVERKAQRLLARQFGFAL
jgi:hypothetical protein